MPRRVPLEAKEYLKVDHQGRVTLPKRMRDDLGIKSGDLVLAVRESSKAILIQKLNL